MYIRYKYTEVKNDKGTLQHILLFDIKLDSPFFIDLEMIHVVFRQAIMNHIIYFLLRLNVWCFLKAHPYNFTFELSPNTVNCHRLLTNQLNLHYYHTYTLPLKLRCHHSTWARITLLVLDFVSGYFFFEN